MFILIALLLSVSAQVNAAHVSDSAARATMARLRADSVQRELLTIAAASVSDRSMLATRNHDPVLSRQILAAIPGTAAAATPGTAPAAPDEHRYSTANRASSVSPTRIAARVTEAREAAQRMLRRELVIFTSQDGSIRRPRIRIFYQQLFDTYRCSEEEFYQFITDPTTHNLDIPYIFFSETGCRHPHITLRDLLRIGSAWACGHMADGRPFITFAHTAEGITDARVSINTIFLRYRDVPGNWNESPTDSNTLRHEYLSLSSHPTNNDYEIARIRDMIFNGHVQVNNRHRERELTVRLASLGEIEDQINSDLRDASAPSQPAYSAHPLGTNSNSASIAAAQAAPAVPGTGPVQN